MARPYPSFSHRFLSLLLLLSPSALWACGPTPEEEAAIEAEAEAAADEMAGALEDMMADDPFGDLIEEEAPAEQENPVPENPGAAHAEPATGNPEGAEQIEAEQVETDPPAP